VFTVPILGFKTWYFVIPPLNFGVYGSNLGFRTLVFIAPYTAS
jgi:hypothetical protein